jgi:hypothetical protein
MNEWTTNFDAKVDLRTAVLSVVPKKSIIFVVKRFF